MAGYFLTVDDGMLSDGASVPAWVTGLTGITQYSPGLLWPSAFHDMLLMEKIFRHRTVDWFLFLLVLQNGRTLGHGWLRRWSLAIFTYLGVRIVGVLKHGGQ